ncbi:hypothetical protein GCM10010406_23650 [Streptomyces thermolineatus]|uniref:Integral membrane protein n=1 Tax=Streptomyces thermolineatus TaxID=44033 RepID=A0ABN3LM66_9ACTN
MEILLVAALVAGMVALDVRLSVLVWRIAGLPAFRRALPACLFATAAALSLLRSVGITWPAEWFAFPLNLAGWCLAGFELAGHRRRAAGVAARTPSGGAAEGR